MDNIIKLPAQQALFNSNNRLVDLILPGNSGVYDLSKTYVAVTCTADNLEFTLPADGALAQANGLPSNTAVPDVRLALKHNNSMATIYDECAVPIEALVRNCSMFSANRGKLEDIRRADTLRATMKAYTADIEDIEDSSIGGFAPMAKSNPWASGRFAQLVGVGDTATKMKSHELRINLKDIFNFGAVEAYDSSAYGNLHIHLELNLNKLELKQALSGATMWDRYYHNQTANTPSYPVTHKYSEALPLTFTAGNPTAGIPASDDSIEMAAEYQSLEDSPFYVNQILSVTTTYDQAAGGSYGAVYPTAATGAVWAVVRSITWDKTTKRITLGFGAGSEVLTIAGPIDTHNLTVNREVVGLAATPASMAAGLTIQSVELTAVRRPDMDAGPAQNQYTQFITQSDQWQNSKSLNRSYYLPPQTTNAYIMMPSSDTTGGAPANFSDILGCARLEHYRFTLNGESVTNRVVPYMPTPAIAAAADTKCDRGSSLHYTLISETMMNAGVRYHSLNESVFDQNIPNSTDIPVTGAGLVGWTNLSDCPKKACYMLSLPVPISNDQTQLTIELEGDFQASSGELHIFSEVRSVA